MKTLLSIPTLLFAALTGIISLHLFKEEYYDISNLLTVTSFLSLVLFVALLTNNVKDRVASISGKKKTASL